MATLSGTSTVTWAKGHGTTTDSFTISIVSPNACKTSTKKPQVELEENATVTGGTGAAGAAIPVGDKGTSFVCVNTKTDQAKQVAGTVWTI